jgi:hypothetical protein
MYNERDKRASLVILIVSAALLLLVLSLVEGPAGVAAANGQGYTLDWWTVDGGGATFSTGGAYALGGSIGQPDAGLLTGGDYTLGGGFWGGGAAAGGGYEIYLPLVLRG